MIPLGFKVSSLQMSFCFCFCFAIDESCADTCNKIGHRFGDHFPCYFLSSLCSSPALNQTGLLCCPSDWGWGVGGIQMGGGRVKRIKALEEIFRQFSVHTKLV